MKNLFSGKFAYLKNMKHIKIGLIKSLSALIVLCILSSCGSDHITVNANFKNTKDIEEGQPVYYDKRQIGEVLAIEEIDRGVRVQLSVHKDEVSKIGARAAVMVNKTKKNHPLEIISRNSRDGEPLSEGQEIRGLDSMLQLGAWMVGDAISMGSSSVADYVDSFQDYLTSDEFEQSAQKLSSEFNRVKSSASEAIKEIEAQLSDSLKDIENAEKEMADALEQAGEDLQPAMDELARSSEEIAVELERLASSLEDLSERERESGQELLDALEESIKRLRAQLEDN